MDAEDLAWNQRGLLGPGQRRAIEAHLRSYGLSKMHPVVQPYIEPWRAALEDGRVVLIDGAVVFDYQAIRDANAALPPSYLPDPGKTAYFAEYVGAGGTRAVVRLAPWLDLQPGPHRLCVALSAGFAIDAASLAASPGVHVAAQYDVLLRAQNLTEATLAANRSGTMTPEQRAALRSWRAYEDNVAPALGCGGALFAVFAIMRAIMDAYAGESSPGSGAKWPKLLAFAVGFFALAVVAAVYRQRKLNAAAEDARDGRVIAVEGPCKKTLVPQRHGRFSKSLQVGDLHFEVNHQGELFAAVVEGELYRAYAAPRSGRLLAIEPAPVHFTSRSR